MNADEIAARMRPGGLTLAFDTNALFAEQILLGTCNDVARLNDRLAASSLPALRLVVCAVAHAEKLFDLKQRFRASFDVSAIVQGLAGKGLLIQPFATNHALETASRLGERYPTTGDWRAAKKKRCLQCLGLREEAAVTATGKGCGATVDWLVGGHARAEGSILVTDDTGPEFAGLVERVRLTTLSEALQGLLREPA